MAFAMPAATQHLNAEKGIALEGYDAVAYVSQQKAVKGKSDLTIKHEGVLYYFSTEANRQKFRENPHAFQPQYGGWCAYAMGATGEKVEVDPETFKIINGRLYLFYNRFFNNTLTKWNAEEQHLKAEADKNWKKIAQ
jgi:YHS domain-containing protein